MMRWNPTGKNFEKQWLALQQVKDAETPDVPKISKTLPIMKWRDAFIDMLGQCIGIRDISLMYLIRPDVAVPDPPAALQAHPPVPGALNGLYPHSEDAGSIGDELILRASHDHVHYKVDNKKLYYLLAEATVSTQHATTLRPYQRTHDGRAGFLSLISQHAGHDKWNIEVKKADAFLHSAKWKGTGNFLLETFCNKHRQANETLKSAHATGIPYQLPSQHTRVGYLLDSIETTDAELNAAMAQVRTTKDDVAQTGLRYDFELAVTTLTPSDPVARRRTGAKVSDGHTVADVDASLSPAEAAEGKLRSGIGKSGVALRWHKTPEYRQLSKEQRDELWRWRKKEGEYSGRKSTPKTKFGIPMQVL